MQWLDVAAGSNSARTLQWLNMRQKPYEELRRATNNFKTKLGTEVYYGENPDDPSDKWAVKVNRYDTGDAERIRLEVSVTSTPHITPGL